MEPQTLAVAAPRAWQSKSEWEALVENIAQSHARLASGIQLAIEKQWGNNFTGASVHKHAYMHLRRDSVLEVRALHVCAAT